MKKKITTPPIEITDSETMNKLILERNKNHLKQAKDTPFANTILGKKLGWDGNGVMGDEILDGQWTNNYELHEVSVEYIKGLQQKDTSVLNKVRGSITIEEHKKFWRKKGRVRQLRRLGSILGTIRRQRETTGYWKCTEYF